MILTDFECHVYFNWDSLENGHYTDWPVVNMTFTQILSGS